MRCRIYAAEHGAKAIYAEKALCASVDEADAICAALQKNDVILNLGTVMPPPILCTG